MNIINYVLYYVLSIKYIKIGLYENEKISNRQRKKDEVDYFVEQWMDCQ